MNGMNERMSSKATGWNSLLRYRIAMPGQVVFSNSWAIEYDVTDEEFEILSITSQNP